MFWASFLVHLGEAMVSLSVVHHHVSPLKPLSRAVVETCSHMFLLVLWPRFVHTIWNLDPTTNMTIKASDSKLKPGTHISNNTETKICTYYMESWSNIQGFWLAKTLSASLSKLLELKLKWVMFLPIVGHLCVSLLWVSNFFGLRLCSYYGNVLLAWLF